MVHVNYLAVLVAAVAVFVLGWLWYSPLLFYKPWMRLRGMDPVADRKSTRLNSSHSQISYAVFCLKKKKCKVDITCYKTCPLVYRIVPICHHLCVMIRSMH